MQNLILPKLAQDELFREQFYSELRYKPHSLPRSQYMRRTFHLDCLNGKLNVSECTDDTQVKLSINETEITLDFDAFNELCALKYTLNLQQRSF